MGGYSSLCRQGLLSSSRKASPPPRGPPSLEGLHGRVQLPPQPPSGQQGLVPPLVQSWRQGGHERERGGEKLGGGETLLPPGKHHSAASQLGKRRASPAAGSCRVPAASISSHCSSASPSCGIPTLPWKQRISRQLAAVLRGGGTGPALPVLLPLSPFPGAGLARLPDPFCSPRTARAGRMGSREPGTKGRDQMTKYSSPL